MTIVNITEENNTKYLVISQQKDPSTLITTRVLITDNSNNTIKLVDIQRGPQGSQGPQGPQGLPGINGVSFSVLPISSGGTNNTAFSNNKIIYYDGSKLSSTDYSVDDLLGSTNINSITGIIPNTGLSKITNGSTVVLNTNLGDGLTVDVNNNIIVDNSIVRKVELSIGNIDGIVGIGKGGTNNSIFNTNRLVYFDGSKLASFPLETGRIVTSGSTLNIVAGSGLVGGGLVSLPSGSIVINIPQSEDIFVSENLVSLSPTGSPGTYTKVTTDIKGRVISGASLTAQDIIDILGYIPWHASNDGSGSGLDADKLDGNDSNYYLNLNNMTGTLANTVLESITTPGTFSKVSINDKGLVLNGTSIEYSDVVSALGYRPASTTGDIIYGNTDIIGNVNIFNGKLKLQDNLPIFSYNNNDLLPNEPRGFSFVYGGILKQTGILAYYPADNQLKLITNIFGTGIGETGDESIVLLEQIGNQKYVQLTTNQIISGLKTFANALEVYNYTNIIQSPSYLGPPVFVGGNSGLVTNFNSDLLDDKHGSYYRDAINLTGILHYNNTIVSNISGSNSYIPKFDNRTNGPSRTISDSIIRQSGNSVIIVDYGSLSVGNNNTINGDYSAGIGSNNNIVANNSLSVGVNGVTSGLNSASIGSNNTTSGANSLAINYGSTTSTDNSLAMGSYGTTWMNNQLTIGAFQDTDPNNISTRIGLGQHSIAAIGYKGITAGSYQTLTPQITIPNNKTILYNIDLLFSKFAGNNVAALSFTSGIVKNSNGTPQIIQDHQKFELYNNSQIREYNYNVRLGSTTNQNQILSVTQPPLINNNLRIQNLPSISRIKPILSSISGVFNKTFDGAITVKMNKPIYSGWFEQSEDNPTIKIKSYNHSVVTGSVINTQYTSGIVIKPINNNGAVVKTILNKDEFIVSDTFFVSSYKSGIIDILDADTAFIDDSNKFSFSGTLSTSSNLITSCTPNINGHLFSGMPLSIINGFSSFPIITAVSGSTVALDIPYTGSYSPNTYIEFNKYSYYRFFKSKSIFISSDSNDYNIAVDVTGGIVTTPSGFSIGVNAVGFPSEVNSLLVCPTLNNSGLLFSTHKKNYDGSYSRNTAIFPQYDVTYIQYPSVSNSGSIDLSARSIISGFVPDYNPYIKFLTATNSFSGILTSGSNTIVNCSPIQSGQIFSGMLLTSNISGFPTNALVTTSPTGDSIILSSPFIGSGTASGLIVYSGEIPPTDNYFKTENLYNNSGIRVQRLYNNISGAYLTGTAVIYPGYGYANLNVSLFDIVNLGDNEIAYINFKTVDTGIIPVSNNYYTSGSSVSFFSIRTQHLMPDSGISATGLSRITLDKDHGYVKPAAAPNLSQLIPLSFNSLSQYIVQGTDTVQPYTGISPANRIPKDGLFEIIDVSGDVITLNDNDRYLIKEINNISFFDIAQTTQYTRDSGNNSLAIKFNKNYFQTNDQIYCFFDDNRQNQNYRITGIDTNSELYYVRPVSGSVTGINESGILSYIGSASGSVVSYTNKISFDTLGGRSETWGRDIAGSYIDHPLSGFFRVYDSPSLCQSGTLCIHISGISNFTNVLKGEKYLYDFIDMTPVLTGVYAINDKISNNIITLNIPYNPTYIGQNGLVYLINSLENIKTNKNPNYSNVFLSPNMFSNNSIYDNYLSTYNRYTKKWKYAFHLKNTLVPAKYIENYTINIDSQSASKETTFIVLTPEDLSASIEYSIDGLSYSSIINNEISIPVNSNLKFKIITKNGAGRWSSIVNEAAPRVNLLGIADYQIIDDQIVYNTQLSQWEIIVHCGVITKPCSNKNLRITISDESGRIFKNINFNVFVPLSSTNIENVSYGYISGGLYWRLLFEVYGGNLSNSQTPNIALLQGYPDFASAYSTVEYLDYPSGWYGVTIEGLPGSSTGVFHPVVRINDGLNSIDRTGNLIIRPGDGPPKPYELSFRTFNNNIVNKYLNTEFNDFGFTVPVDTNIDSNISIILTNTSSLVINNPVIEYRPNLHLYTYRANISGSPGFYNPQINVSISQPSGDVPVVFTKSTGLNLTIYNNMYIDSDELVKPLSFDINKEWAFDFYIKDGGSSYRSDVPPKVYLANTPNIGRYITSEILPLEYNIAYYYNNNQYWKISVTGKRDIFGEASIGTGNYPIYIYAEDNTGYITGLIDTNVTGSPYLLNLNLSQKKFSTPNNGFDFNVDIGGVGYGAQPSLSIPTNLTDSLIVPSRTYYKFDSNTNIWEAAYSCLPLVEKWDAQVFFSNNTLFVRAKGILQDKLYVAGKVSTVETDNTMNNIFKPLKIVGLQTNYKLIEGDTWKIAFHTEGGLENNQYPPEIQLLGLPTPCTGYDPRIPDITNNSCFTFKRWRSDLKIWEYQFDGNPLCLNAGQFDINIVAKDRIEDTTYDTDSKTTQIIYNPLGDHPVPTISGFEDLVLYPNCQPYQSNQARYKINLRDACPKPTGITGLIMWGNLPAGLTVYDSRAGDYSSPFKDLSGGYVTIQGNPTTFANGGFYPETFNIAVVDARNKSGVLRDIIFIDASQAIPPSPTDITIYFAESGYHYTPSGGELIIRNSVQSVVRPPASPFSMQCLSVLPHNQCLYSTGIYSIVDNNTIRLSGYGTSLSIASTKRIESGHKIYIEFDNQINPIFNQEYIATRINNNAITINSSGHGINSLTSGLVKILKTQSNIKDSISIDTVFPLGNPPMYAVDTTTTGLLGGGTYKSIPTPPVKGFIGRMKPALIASLASGVNRSTSIHLEDFIINTLPGESDSPYVITFTNNCYETGHVRVSGLILPSPTIESTDPPPQGGNSYSYNNQGPIAATIRTAYGANNLQRSNPLNARSLGDINYTIFNISENLSVFSGSIGTDPNGIATITFNLPNLSSGAVYSWYLERISADVFPTYNKRAIPTLTNIYHWIHKADEDILTPTYSSFPSVVPITDKSLVLISGNNTYEPISFMGGYIPKNTFSYPYGGWNYQNFPAHVTGYQQKIIPNIYYTGTYGSVSNTTNINLQISNNVFSSGDPIYVTFQSYNLYQPMSVSSTGIIISGISGNIITLNNAVSSPASRSGTIQVYDLVRISSGDVPYHVKLSYRTGISEQFYPNKQIELINVHSMSSTQMNIFPNNYTLNVFSAENGYCFAGVGSFVTSGILTSGSNIISNCSANPLNILNTGVILHSPTHSLPENHSVSAISSDSITLTEPYSGINTSNALIYFQGYDTIDFYSSLLGPSGTGLCSVRENIVGPDNTQSLSFDSGNNFTANGRSIYPITGIPTALGSYIYRVITSENINLPLVTGSPQWAPKKYAKDYSLLITTPPKIISQSDTISIVNNTWAYSFAVTGGYVPRSNRFLEIELNGLIHTFSRSQNIVSDSGILITLTSKPGFNWTNIFQSPVSLKVYDDTGYDTKYITAIY
jgi:hypothetical protein